MAQSCEIVCNNQNCGYDQSTRNSLRQEAIKHNFDLSKRAEQIPIEVFVDIANNL